MGKLLILSMIAASLILGGCRPGAEGANGTPVSAAQLAERIQSGSAPLILDVRTRDEFERGHIPGAINIPHDELSVRLSELTITKSDEVVVHCQSGRRAEAAEETLRGSGYANVRDLEGHWQGWIAAKRPTE